MEGKEASVIKQILSYLKAYIKECIISPLFKLLESVFDLLVPIIVKQIIDDGIGNHQLSTVTSLCLVLIGFAVIGLACALVAQYFAAKTAVGVATDLRHDLFARIGHLSYTQTDRIGTATLITRMTGDVNQIQSAINLTLRLLLRSPIIVLGAMLMAFTVDVQGAWVFAVVVPLLSVIIFTILLVNIPHYKRVQKSLDSVTALTRENLNGVRVLRAFRLEEEEQNRFDEAIQTHNRAQNLVGKISALLNPLTLVIVNLGIIVLLLSGGKLVQIGEMSQGDVVALTNYMAQILVELIKFANTILTVNKALASADRVKEVLQLPIGMETSAPLVSASDDKNYAVSFHNVSLTYGGTLTETLSNINLRVPARATIGIIGSTGAGKSSLVNLIPRFYDATSGMVQVDGKDVRSYSPEALRQKIAVVPQKTVLFAGTVRSNLLWGNANATDEELWQALEWAQAKDFILQKKLGLDEPVAQNGKNFSGGQRQRLTIARALVRKPEILILDDSSSALDYATDAALRAALKALPYRPTVFLISQRTSSIRHADIILVLEDGHTVGIGTHKELLEHCEVYREIHNSQYHKGGDSV